MKTVDVLIAGGGPAGLATGIVCARNGLHTLVCEQSRLPQDKACGEGLMPVGLIHLEQLGAKSFLAPGDYFPFRGVAYISPGGAVAHGSFREGPGWGIPRRYLSKALVQKCKTLPQLEIWEGARLKLISGQETGSRTSLMLAEIGEECIATRLLVGADGLNSLVRRRAGLEKTPRARDNRELQRWGARQHYALSPWSEFVEVYWQVGVEAYVTPVGPCEVDVAFLWDRRRLRKVSGGRELIPGLLKLFPTLAERLKGGLPYDFPLAVGPLYRTSVAPVGQGVVLIGDAAGYLDAITGEGISLALAHALAFEEKVVPDLVKGKTVKTTSLASFAHAYRGIMAPYYRMTRLALYLSRHPVLATSAIALLSRSPNLFAVLLSANMGFPGEVLQKHIR